MYQKFFSEQDFIFSAGKSLSQETHSDITLPTPAPPMSMHGILFTPSGDVVDPTGDIVAQMNGETEAQPVQATAAAPEPPAPAAEQASQDLLDTARARAGAMALIQKAQANLERVRKAAEDRKRKRDEEEQKEAAAAAPKAAKTNAGRRSSRNANKPKPVYIEVDEDHDMSDEERELSKQKAEVSQRKIVKPKSAKSSNPKPKWSDEQHQRFKTLMRKAIKSESESSCDETFGCSLQMIFGISSEHGETNKMLVFKHFHALEGLHGKKLKVFINLLKSKGVDPEDGEFWSRENLWKALDRKIVRNDKWFLAKCISCDNSSGVVFQLTFRPNPPLTSEENEELKALVKSAVHHTGVKKVQDSFNTSYVAQYRLVDFVVEWIKTNGKKLQGKYITPLGALRLVRKAINASPFRFSYGKDEGLSLPEKPSKAPTEEDKDRAVMLWEIYLPCDGVFSLGYGCDWTGNLEEAFAHVWGKDCMSFASGCQLSANDGILLYASYECML